MRPNGRKWETEEVDDGESALTRRPQIANSLELERNGGKRKQWVASIRGF